MSTSLSVLPRRGIAAAALAPWVIGVITGIEVVADPERLAALDIVTV